jgi:hypothetical protein
MATSGAIDDCSFLCDGQRSHKAEVPKVLAQRCGAPTHSLGRL